MSDRNCAHEPCSCRIAADDLYCSDDCRRRHEASSTVEDSCGCAHVECITSRGIRTQDEEALTHAPEPPVQGAEGPDRGLA